MKVTSVHFARKPYDFKNPDLLIKQYIKKTLSQQTSVKRPLF